MRLQSTLAIQKEERMMEMMEMRRKPQFLGGGIEHATINGHRFHLRRGDPIEDNFLWIDGRQPPIVLDRTGAEFVTALIEGMWRFQQGEGDESRAVIDYVVTRMYAKYGRPLALSSQNRVTRERIKADLNRIFGTLMAIAEGGCPAELTMGPKEIKYGQWIAPARMDLAVTYGCNLGCEKCYLGNRAGAPNLRSPLPRELTLQQWTEVYRRLWELGVPQVVFTGGEPTLRPDILELIGEAEEFVTGMVTNGTRLAQLAKQLKDVSLDYVQVTIESANPQIHDLMTRVVGSHGQTVFGIIAALNEGLQVVTNTTLTKQNAGEFLSTMRFLAQYGVRHIACNTLICSGRGTACRQQNGLSDQELNQILEQARALADELQIELQWYSPTCYTLGVNPLKFGFGIKACSAAAHNMTIQPDGTVLPCQSWPDPVGNILTDPWSNIWNHPTCLKLRQHAMKDAACNGCAFESTCAGGCPLDMMPRVPTAKQTEGGTHA